MYNAEIVSTRKNRQKNKKTTNIYYCNTDDYKTWPTAGDLTELRSYDNDPAYVLVVSPLSEVPSPWLNTFSSNRAESSADRETRTRCSLNSLPTR